jgi:hypothetical protein
MIGIRNQLREDGNEILAAGFYNYGRNWDSAKKAKEIFTIKRQEKSNFNFIFPLPLST